MKSSFIFPEPPAHVLEIGHAAKYSHAVTYGQRLRLERLLLSLKFQIIMSGFSLKEEAQRELDEEYKMRNEVRKLWLQNIKI